MSVEVAEKKMRFLLVEDDKDDVYIVKKMIFECETAPQFELDVASTVDEFHRKLNSINYDLFLLDYKMGVGNGLELLKILREKFLDHPIIMLTGKGDQQTVVEALRLGATDYINKNNLTAETLDHAVQRGLRLHKAATEKLEMQANLNLQKNLLAGLSQAVSILLTTSDNKSAVVHALEAIVKAINAEQGSLIEYDSSSTLKEEKWVLGATWKEKDHRQGSTKIKDKLAAIENEPELLEILEEFKNGATEEQASVRNAPGFSNSLFIPVRVHKKFFGVLHFVMAEGGTSLPSSAEPILKTFASSLGWELKRIREAQTLKELIEQTSGETGNEFFQALVVNLASALEVRFAYVSELVETGSSLALSLKGWDGNELATAKQYDLRNTPAEEILCGMYSYYPENTKNLFPHVEFLQSNNIEGFAAVPFYSSSGNLLGHLSVMSETPFSEQERILSILRLFGARAGAELERQRSESEIRSMAYYDSLTGLPNRVLLQDRMDLALRQARRNKSHVAVLYLDFDNFKSINDTYGHMCGDLLLKEGARRLSDCLRKGDTVSRLGGDEFVIVLPDIKSPSDVARLALKINTSIKAPFLLEDTEIKISVSVGIACFPKDGDNPKVLLKKADTALFSAKRAGRDNFQFVEPDEITDEK